MTCTLPEGGLIADIARFDRDSLKKVTLVQDMVARDLVRDLVYRPTRPVHAAYGETSFYLTEASTDEDDEDSDMESDWSDLVEDEVDDDANQDSDDSTSGFLLVQRTQPTFHPTPHAELLAAIRQRVPKCTRTRTRRRSYVLWRPTPEVDRSPSPVRPVPILRCPDLTLCASLSLSEASEWSDDD
ncbi:hypothetical protein SPRG_09972 [Saprolegnia parasitica CBS 223.65]|uniref:Uncharacterized protein n=1 Tax=Saprolegnia parasitica (strain CBS 223.65) TaxID=695850 RepID=A0A067BXB6_SAPPC|nr:hypothetical protein SPRG_09972 [Saprolegnia parasitica CBS 223.65]KDO23164.1 hypothetical protein SPRG_09972 [Saprolegnia parasitica CBS 223.65]|eukprot:XP_012206116.1 hypothetical protein SPRG_09972 [Saprolegnia parasitica CBS 223.65]